MTRTDARLGFGASDGFSCNIADTVLGVYTCNEFDQPMTVNNIR
jgi:hypothetical protein